MINLNNTGWRVRSHVTCGATMAETSIFPSGDCMHGSYLEVYNGSQGRVVRHCLSLVDCCATLEN